MFAEGQDHKLLKETISHHELLGGTRDVTVVVKDAHTGESGDLHLEGHVGGQVNLDLGFASGVRTNVSSAREGSSEGLVPNLINHFGN